MTFIPIPHSRIATYKTQFWFKKMNNRSWPRGLSCKFAHSHEEKREIFDPISWGIEKLYTENEIYGKNIDNFSKSSNNIMGLIAREKFKLLYSETDIFKNKYVDLI